MSEAEEEEVAEELTEVESKIGVEEAKYAVSLTHERTPALEGLPGISATLAMSGTPFERPVQRIVDLVYCLCSESSILILRCAGSELKTDARAIRGFDGLIGHIERTLPVFDRGGLD